MNPLEALHQQFLEEKRKLALAEQQDNDSRTTEPTVATTEAMSTNNVKDPHTAYRKQFQEKQERQLREWQEVQKRPLEKKREEERQQLNRQQELLEPQGIESIPSEMTAAATEPSPEAPVQKHPPQQSRHQHDGSEQLTAAEHHDVARKHEPVPRKIAAKTRLIKHRSARSKNNDHGQKELQSAVDLLSKMTEPKMTEPKNRKISAGKIEANRKNASKSTGPKSIQGKQTVASNAMKHGFLSRVAVIKDRDGGESQDEFDQLYAKLRANLQPIGCMEELLVERIAVSHWRKRRLLRYENGMISDRFACRRDAIATRLARWGKPDLCTERQLELDTRTDHVCMPRENVELILRYEAMIEKQMNRDFAMLQQLQLRRKSLRTPGNGATSISLELVEPRRQVIGNAVDESNPNNLVSSASNASNIRQTDNTACSAEGGTIHAQRPVTDASYPQQVCGAVPVAEELMEPQTQEVGSDAGDLRQVDGAGPSPEEIKSQAQGPEEQGERFYETKPRSALFSDSPADHLPDEGNSATSTNKNGEDV